MVKCAVRTSTLDEPSLPVVHIDTKYYEQAIWGEETGTETTLLRRPNRALPVVLKNSEVLTMF